MPNIGLALRPGGPGGGMDKLAAAGDLDRVVDIELVVVRRVLRDSDRGAVHDLVVDLAEHNLDAAATREAWLAAGHRYGAQQLPVLVHLQRVRLEIHQAHHRPADLELADL